MTYIGLMRLTVYVSEDLGKRLEPYRDRINISRVLQGALEQEVRMMESTKEGFEQVTLELEDRDVRFAGRQLLADENSDGETVVYGTERGGIVFYWDGRANAVVETFESVEEFFDGSYIDEDAKVEVADALGIRYVQMLDV